LSKKRQFFGENILKIIGPWCHLAKRSSTKKCETNFRPSPGSGVRRDGPSFQRRSEEIGVHFGPTKPHPLRRGRQLEMVLRKEQLLQQTGSSFGAKFKIIPKSSIF
jgi:hypothetical protein